MPKVSPPRWRSGHRTSHEEAGALTAGLFLQEFVADDIPWVHLDIAGPAFLDADNVDMPKGGTGFGVRLLLDLIANFKPADLRQ